MMLSAIEYRALGQTGLRVPPVVFGTAALGNAFRAIPEQTKTAICCEWFKCVSPPVVIDIAAHGGAALALKTIIKVLQRVEIAPNELVICNRLGWNRMAPTGALSYDAILKRWEDESRPLGRICSPQLVSIDDLDEYLDSATSSIERELRFQDVLEAYRALDELKTQGRVAGVGAKAKDWRILREIDARVPLDWGTLQGSFTILRHPPELFAFMASRAVRQIGIINSAVFQGGFLVGGKCFNDRAPDPENTDDKPLFLWRKSFVALCQGHGVSPAHACIQFALNAPGVVAVTVNTSRPDRIQEHVRLSATKVPDAFWASMKEEGLIAADYSHVG